MKTKGKHRDDADIIALYFERDQRAVSETESKYGAYLGTVAYNILGDHADAEECISDALSAAWNSIPPARPDSLKAFLASLMRRRALDRYRRTHRRCDIPTSLKASLDELDFLVSDDTDVHGALENSELSRVIDSFVKGLTKRRRYIFIGRFYLARKVDDIARRLGVSRSSVNKELARIRGDLREALEKEGYSV